MNIEDTLSEEDLRHFIDIANTAIYLVPQDFPLNHDTVHIVSKQIQEDFIDAYDDKYTAFYHHSPIVFGERDKLEILPRKKIADGHNEPSKYEMTKLLLCYLSINNFNREPENGNNYNNAGFTPKLMEISRNLLGGLNCFGTNAFVGSHLRQQGINVRLGIAQDHPVLFVTIDSITYLVDGVGTKTTLDITKGEFKDYGNYSIYYPEETERVYLTKMIMVHDFDRALVYEILENLEAYKQIKLQGKHLALPGYESASDTVNQLCNELITRGDWRKMQWILFPEIAHSFVVHKKEWQAEHMRVRKMRKDHETQEEILITLRESWQKAEKNSGMRNVSRKKIARLTSQLFPSIDEGVELTSYFKGDINFSTTQNSNAKIFLRTLKSDIESIESKEKRDIAVDIIVKNLIPSSILVFSE